MPDDINKPPDNPPNPVPPPSPVIPVKPVPPHNPAPANAIVNAEPPPSGNQVGVFTTPQSFLTFSGSTAAVTIISKVLIGVGIISANNRGWWMLIISFAIGLVIYIATVSSGTTWRQKVLEAALAIVNTFTIAAAVLGVDVITTSGNNLVAPSAPSSSPNTNTRSFYQRTLSDGREVSIVNLDEKPKLRVR